MTLWRRLPDAHRLVFAPLNRVIDVQRHFTRPPLHRSWESGQHPFRIRLDEGTAEHGRCVDA